MASMRAQISITADEDRVRDWLELLYNEEGDDLPPDPYEWFCMRVRELVEDEISVALMFGPCDPPQLDYTQPSLEPKC